MVRQLEVPIGFAADLPFGPVPQRGSPSCTMQSPWELGYTELCDGSPAHDVIPDVVLQSLAVIPSSHMSCESHVVEGCDHVPLNTLTNIASSHTPSDTWQRSGSHVVEGGDHVPLHKFT